MERPHKRLAFDGGVGLLGWLPADLWNFIAWTLLSPSDRTELRAACRFFHIVCWRRGVSLKWIDVVQRSKLHDSLNTWEYIAEIKAMEAADASARTLLARCSSLTSISFASADEQPSSALWLPPPSAFPRLKRVAFELDDCLTGELGSWACGVTSLTSVELAADDAASCRTWRTLAARTDHDHDQVLSVGDDSCSSAEDEPETSGKDLSRLPITSLILSIEDPLPSHKLAAICRTLDARLLRLELHLGNVENPISSPNLEQLSLLTRLRALYVPSIEQAGRFRLPTLPTLEVLDMRLHDTSFSLRCVSAMTSLRSLRITSAFSGERISPDLLTALRSLFNLTELNLSHSPEELDANRVPAADLSHLSLLTNLTRIKLRANYEPARAEDFASLLHFPQLCSLELSYCDLRVLLEHDAWSPLSRLTCLSLLKLKAAPMAERAEQGLASVLRNLPLLTTLDLELNTQWTCAPLREAFSHLPRLRVLSLGTVSCAQFEAMLPVLTLLHSLSFWPSGAPEPVDLCASLPQLRWLRFAPLTSWIELTPNPFVLLHRIPEACLSQFYHYGYLRHVPRDTAM